MQKDLNYYKHRFQNFRVNPVGGIAPYQPILLLSIIELIDRGIIKENRIYLTTTLMSVFVKYRSQLSTPRYQADLAQPFFFLSRAKNPYWFLQPKSGFEEILDTGAKLNTINLLMRSVSYAFFEDELFVLLESSINRGILIAAIITEYFSDKTSQIQKLFGINPLPVRYSQVGSDNGILIASEQYDNAAYKSDSNKNIEEIVRDATFRRNIKALYDYRCAFCKIRIVSINDENILDGSHIKPFSEFKDDSYTNGISLCKNHHWAFDHGWFGIASDHKIIIPRNRFDEQPPDNSKSMSDFHEELIYLPDQQEFYPRDESLQWHRERWNIA